MIGFQVGLRGGIKKTICLQNNPSIAKSAPNGISVGNLNNGDVSASTSPNQDTTSGLNLTKDEYLEAVKNGLWSRATILDGVANDDQVKEEGKK